MDVRTPMQIVWLNEDFLMHVVVGMLGTLVTVLWLLYRLAEMGIDLGGLNPFLWQRRRKWKKHYDANPVFKLDSPMEATALLIIATAKADGDMSSEEKRAILEIFENEFHLCKKDAAGLLISSSHLLGKGDEVRNSLNAVLSPSLSSFTEEQAVSAIALIRRVADIDGSATGMQDELIGKTSSILRQASTERQMVLDNDQTGPAAPSVCTSGSRGPCYCINRSCTSWLSARCHFPRP